MKIGVAVGGTWGFFHEIYAELAEHHQTSLFSPKSIQLPIFHERINRHLLRRDMQAFLRQNDVVFFEWASELLAKASHLPKRCGMVTRLHRFEMYRWADSVNWNAVDRIILVSRAKKREFAARFPAQAPKVIVIPEAVSLTKFQAQPKRFEGNIGILGHLSPRKRVYELILAFSELVQQSNGLHLHVGGGKHPLFLDYHEAVHSLVQKLGIQDRVTFYDHVDDPASWYQHIDIFVSNSYSEGLQVSPMEAMASGCYCLAHRWAGAEELLPEECLFLGSSELQQKILDYCALAEPIRQEHRHRLQAMVGEKFNVAKTRVQIRQAIEEIEGHVPSDQ